MAFNKVKFCSFVTVFVIKFCILECTPFGSNSDEDFEDISVRTDDHKKNKIQQLEDSNNSLHKENAELRKRLKEENDILYKACLNVADKKDSELTQLKALDTLCLNYTADCNFQQLETSNDWLYDENETLHGQLEQTMHKYKACVNDNDNKNQAQTSTGISTHRFFNMIWIIPGCLLLTAAVFFGFCMTRTSTYIRAHIETRTPKRHTEMHSLVPKRVDV